MTTSFREIYDRHRGPYSLHLVRELINGKGRATQASDKLDGPFSAEDAHEEARLLVKSAKDDVVEVFVFSMTEGQFIGAFYKRGEEHRPWHEEVESGRVELPDERQTAALVSERSQSLQAVDDPLDAVVSAEPLPDDRPVRDVPAKKTPRERKIPAKLPGDRFPVVRGRALEIDLGNAERWPPSPPAQLVRVFFEVPGRRATSAEVVQALAPELAKLGMAHPASLVSRLKQGGFLKEVSE